MDERVYKSTNSSNNLVDIIGYVSSVPEYHHDTHGEKIYKFTIKSPRRNKGVFDTIQVEISERVIDVEVIKEDDLLHIQGEFRSFNEYNDVTGKASLRLYIFVRDLVILDKEYQGEFTNKVVLVGYICKDVIYRVTPSGREISDVILAVNRVYGRSDYLPCIVWSRNARFVSRLSVGTKVCFTGRLQSRIYTKKYDDGTVEDHEVYEVSVFDLCELNMDEVHNEEVVSEVKEG
jgi:primosomal replication protein N|nr:MAG TPA: Single strand binding protein [Bacteriophage sp.]